MRILKVRVRKQMQASGHYRYRFHAGGKIDLTDGELKHMDKDRKLLVTYAYNINSTDVNNILKKLDKLGITDERRIDYSTRNSN